MKQSTPKVGIGFTHGFPYSQQILKDDFKAGYVASSDYDDDGDLIFCGYLEDFTDEEIGELGGVCIIDKKVFLRLFTSEVHECAVYSVTQALGVSILRSFGEDDNFKSDKEIEVNTFAKYVDGKIKRKRADFVLMSENDRRVFLAGEVAFRGESSPVLLAECVHYLTEYTNVIYSCGFKIYSNQHSEDFRALIFLLRRTLASDVKKVKLLNESIVRGEKTLAGESISRADFSSLKPESIRDLGVELEFIKEIDEINYVEDIQLNLNRKLIDGTEGDINVVIKGKRFAKVRTAYREWWKSKGFVKRDGHA